MADQEQLRILQQGVEAWNDWRRKNPGITAVDLSEADLTGANLTGANLTGANLRAANLTGAFFSRMGFSGANLAGATLSGASLGRVSLISANLSEANLGGVRLNRVDLRGANLTGARLYETVFADVDLSCCKNLDSIVHRGPSTIDIRTLQRSGPLPPVFLRGVGLPDRVIEFLPSLRDDPIQLYRCFISYSSKDEAFVSRLHADLQDNHVRCWRAPHDMKIGAKILDTLDEEIRLRDKVLLVLSAASIASEWVEDEVTTAFEEERRRGDVMLFPVRLDDTVFETKEAWAAKLRARNIGDFRAWKDHDAYQKALARVLRDLRIEASDAAGSSGACRRKIEMTPGAQSRNDTPPAAEHAERNTASLPHAGPGWRGQGPEPAFVGARSAALEAVARAQHHPAAVRTGRTTACRQSRP